LISSTKYWRSKLTSHIAYDNSNGAAHHPLELGSITLYGFARESDMVPEHVTDPYYYTYVIWLSSFPAKHLFGLAFDINLPNLSMTILYSSLFLQMFDFIILKFYCYKSFITVFVFNTSNTHWIRPLSHIKLL